MNAPENHELLKQWQQDRTDLLLQMPFLGLLALRLELAIGDWPAIPTAATDGTTVYGNRHFLAGLTAEERRFVLAHEVWHCAALHPLRRGERDPERWNIAVDHETNAVLQDAGLTVPDDAILFPYWRPLNAEAVYEELRQLPDRGRLADIHELPGIDPTEQRERWRRWPRHVRAALHQAQQRPGDLPGRMARDIDKVLAPKQPTWQQALQQFIGRQQASTYSWTRPHRRHLARGTWLPGRPRDRIRLAVAIDTSRSTRRLLDAFMGELQTILHHQTRADTIRLLTFDRIVQQDFTTAVTDARTALPQLRGGGGTDFRPVFERLASDPPDALIMLTDGRGNRGERRPSFPMLWVVPQRKSTGEETAFTARIG